MVRAARMLVFLVLLCLFCVGAMAGEKVDMVKEFGTSRSGEIHTGYVFIDHRYVEGPYVVERRGLEIYINGHKVRKAPPWPPYDYSVKEDPGDPPEGSSPLDTTRKGQDSRDRYWSRKWRYLVTHHEFDEALSKMLDVYRKCPRVRKMVQDKDYRSEIHLEDDTGKKRIVTLDRAALSLPPTKKEMLTGFGVSKSLFVDLLENGGLLALVPGQDAMANRREAGRVIGILLSDTSREEKNKELAKGDMVRSTSQFEKIVDEFKPTPELLERFNRPMPEREPRKTEPAEPDEEGALDQVSPATQLP